MPQLCCLGSNEPEPSTQVPAYPEAGFMRRVDSRTQPPQYDIVDNGYNPVVPLPRYTARPVSIHEKTIEGNTHEQHHRQQPDEKNRHDFEPEAPLQSHSTGGSSSSSGTVTATMDDASSAYSFPSSFGHTSTDTRDTPPPPYSSCGGSLYSRSRASSLRSSHRRRSDSLSNYPIPNNLGTQSQQPQQHQQMTPYFVPSTIAPPPMAHINSTASTFAPSMTYIAFNSRQSNSRPSQESQRRLSWESR